MKLRDFVVVDRGYCHASGIHYAAGRGAYLTVRLNPDGILLQAPDGTKFNLLEQTQLLAATGQMAEWEVRVPYEGRAPISARLCAVRKPPLRWPGRSSGATPANMAPGCNLRP